MNKKILMGMMALAVSLTFASGLMANEKAATAVTAPAQKMELFNGVIEKVDMSKKDVVVEFQKDKMSFSLNDQTKVFDEGTKVMKLSELKKGEWASVEYNKEGNERIAQIIHLSHFRESGHMFSAEKAPKTSLNW
jgi:Cu/Ag efflux protein CusF